MRILFFGDVVGRVGRKAVKKILPELKVEFQPDLVMANVENLAHGKGVTERTLDEMQDAGIQVFTSGNHIFKKPIDNKIFRKYNLLRPANYPEDQGVPGPEFLKIKINNKNVYIINLMGRVFIREDFDCPFRKFDEIYKQLKLKKDDIIIVDIHAEATSEKKAMINYLTGKVSALLGTHTHIPTADEQITSKKTAYITDVGMTGPADSVLGVKTEIILETFLTQIGVAHDYAEEGRVEINAVIFEINDKTGRAENIMRVNREVDV